MRGAGSVRVVGCLELLLSILLFLNEARYYVEKRKEVGLLNQRDVRDFPNFPFI